MRTITTVIYSTCLAITIATIAYVWWQWVTRNDQRIDLVIESCKQYYGYDFQECMKIGSKKHNVGGLR